MDLHGISEVLRVPLKLGSMSLNATWLGSLGQINERFCVLVFSVKKRS